MKKGLLTLIVLLSLSLALAPAHARTLEDICRECRETWSSCSETIKRLCELLDDTPITDPPGGTRGPGGPCCPSCYCFFLDGVLYVIPLGNLELGEPYFDERSGTPWRTFRLPQFDPPSLGVRGQGSQ